MAKKARGFGLGSVTTGTSTSTSTSVSSSTSKRKPRLVSQDTAESLDLLGKQIQVAEKHLKKMPAAREPGVVVSVSTILSEHHINSENSDSAVLMLTDDGLRVTFTKYSEDEGDYFEYRWERIDDFPTAVRVELAAIVPELIRAAKKAESKIKKLSDDAIAEIRKAIEETMEVYE